LGDRVGWPFRRKRPKRSASDTDPAIDSDTLPAVTAPILVKETAWAAGASDRGLVRANNEDDFLFAPERGLFIVCDGMGGHSAGEIASSRAIHRLDELLSAEALAKACASPADIEDWLRQILQQANDEVLALGQGNEAWENMATTVVVGIVRDGALHAANLGDSRAYLIRNGQAQPLTRDHSVAAALVAQGQLEPERARAHPLRNQLTASLGLKQPVAPFHTRVPLQQQDRLVFCSDGLWDMLPDSEIARIASSPAPPAEVARELIRAANQAGGADNITVIVLIMDREGAPPAGEAQAGEIGQESVLDEHESEMDTVLGGRGEEVMPEGGAEQ
jgi:protein phosphatase